MRTFGEDSGAARLELDLGWLSSLGWTADELICGGLQALLHPDDEVRVLGEFERATQPGGGLDSYMVRLRATDGEYRWFSWQIRTAPDGGVVCAVEEVVERRDGDGVVPSPFAEEHFRTMADSSPALMWFADVEGRFEFVNRAWLAFTGQSLGEVIGTRWADGAHPAEVRRLEDRLAPGARPVEFTVEYRRMAAGGEARWLLDSVVPRLDGDDRVVGWLGTGMDIHERKALEAQLRHQADHDALTGLVNRRRFEAELDRQLEGTREHGRPGAVLLIDIDHFKRVNDTLGHAQGDRVLTAVADALTDRVRSSDLVARLGGDEFAIVLARIGPQQVRRVADDLLECVRLREPGTTISVGAACFDRYSAAGVDDLLTAADRALYAAKAEGRDRAVLASEPSAVA